MKNLFQHLKQWLIWTFCTPLPVSQSIEVLGPQWEDVIWPSWIPADVCQEIIAVHPTGTISWQSSAYRPHLPLTGSAVTLFCWHDTRLPEFSGTRTVRIRTFVVSGKTMQLHGAESIFASMPKRYATGRYVHLIGYTGFVIGDDGIATRAMVTLPGVDPQQWIMQTVGGGS